MKIARNNFIYIVECSDKSYYTAVTNNLERRTWEHNNDENALAYTFKRRPVVLKYFQRFQDIIQVIACRKQIKGWSRKKKEALFVKDWVEIKRLAKSYSKGNCDTINPSSASSG
jgi:putative endonuclease